MTQGKKQRYWKPGSMSVLAMMCQIAKNLGAPAPDPETLTWEWADSVAPDIRETAETLELLARAEAASTETLVKMQHPDWTDEEVSEEVARIRGQAPAPLPNPFDVRPDPTLPEEEEEVEE